MSDADCTPGSEPRSVAASFTNKQQTMQSTHNTHSTAPVLQHRDKYLDSDRVDGAADLKTSLLEHHD